MVKKNEKYNNRNYNYNGYLKRDRLENKNSDKLQNNIEQHRDCYYDEDEQQKAIQIARAKLAAAKAHLENCEEYTSSSACSLSFNNSTSGRPNRKNTTTKKYENVETIEPIDFEGRQNNDYG